MIIVLMYVCVCNAITEKAVLKAVSNGASSLADLQAELGVATCCGCCAQMASGYLQHSSSASCNNLQANCTDHKAQDLHQTVSAVRWK